MLMMSPWGTKGSCRSGGERMEVEPVGAEQFGAE